MLVFVRLFFSVVMCLSVTLIGCSGDDKTVSTTKGTVGKDGQLILNIGAEPSSLNPLLTTDTASSKVTSFIFNGLMRVNEKLEMVPDLAKKVEISKDGKTYTFTLHDNVTWHDGRPLTADDVKFTFDTLLDKKTNTVRRSNYIIDGEPVRFEVVSPKVIKAILPKVYAPFLVHMGMDIIPKHLYEGTDVNTSPVNRTPVGTGPFKFDDWKSGQYVRVLRNDAYFKGEPKLGSILMKIVPDTQTSFIALHNGELDIAQIPFKEAGKVRASQPFKAVKYQGLNYSFMAFNLKHPLFKDRALRQAIAHSINKEAIVGGVLRGYGHVAEIPQSPASWAYPEKGSFETYPYDPATAKRILNNAGYTWDSDGRLLTNGAPVEFTVITNKGNKDREKAAQIIQRFLHEIGIDMKIKLMEWSSFIKLVNAPQDPKEFDAVILGWSLGIDPDGTPIWHSKEYPRGFNFIGYHNSQVDTLLDKGRAEVDRTKRKTIYDRLYHEISADIPYIFLFYPDSVVGVNKRVGGLAEPGPAGLIVNPENVFITQ